MAEQTDAERLAELKAEFEGVELEWRLHEKLRELFAMAERQQAEISALRADNLGDDINVGLASENRKLKAELAEARRHAKSKAAR